jgi:Ni,Fe-hydrogenase I cytochrome b subunit
VTSLTFAIAGLSLTLALAAAAAVGILVMFGPSLFTGDFIGLPWYTMLPAWLLAAFVGVWVYMRFAYSLSRRFTS